MRNNYIRKAIFGIKHRLWPVMDDGAANRLIAHMILERKPMMVARFGAVEIKGVMYGTLPPPLT